MSQSAPAALCQDGQLALTMAPLAAWATEALFRSRTGPTPGDESE